MKYKFNLKIQLIYAVVTFAVSFLILYLFTKEFDWITPSIIGVFEFIIAGFYTQMHKKKA
jgi:1,4-dihydroxy-2-naphthoate octaprenyltransferase